MARAQAVSTSEITYAGFDFEHLERVVGELIEERRRLVSENTVLRQELLERERAVKELDQKVSLQEQKRTDALKRIDDLLAQVEGFATLASHAAER